jgi:hypothetical protein
MVREVRPVTLTSGDNRLRIQEVSRLMDPRSVLLGWQGKSGAELVAHSYDLAERAADGEWEGRRSD